MKAFSADFGAGAVFTACVTEGERLVRQLWHYTPITVEKSKRGPACSV